MKKYWKIKELTALGYNDEVCRADEDYYGFDHSPVDGSLLTSRSDSNRKGWKHDDTTTKSLQEVVERWLSDKQKRKKHES